MCHPPASTEAISKKNANNFHVILFQLFQLTAFCSRSVSLPLCHLCYLWFTLCFCWLVTLDPQFLLYLFFGFVSDLRCAEGCCCSCRWLFLPRWLHSVIRWPSFASHTNRARWSSKIILWITAGKFEQSMGGPHVTKIALLWHRHYLALKAGGNISREHLGITRQCKSGTVDKLHAFDNKIAVASREQDHAFPFRGPALEQEQRQ